jgi:hypothetical protein
MKDEIIIKPIKLQEYTCKQSKHDIAPKLPLRSIILSPSGGGKTVLLSNLILNVYRGCFERVFVFSPSVHVDATWNAVKDYQENIMKVKESPKEQLYFDHYSPEDLQNIIDTQHQVILHMKKRNLNQLYSILIIVDDFADDPSFSRHSKLLHSLFTRGRHSSISTIVSTQKFTSVAQIIRVNATFLCVYRLRNQKDLDAFLEEVSGAVGRKELLEIYNLATKEPYSFLYINLLSSKINDMFYINFNQQIILSD